MPIQWVWYGKLKDEKFQPWLEWWRNEDNMKRVKETATEGMKFMGLYVTINSTVEHDYELWWELENWAVLDRERDNEESAELMKDLFKEHGWVWEWNRTKVFRTVHDVKSPIFD